MASDVKFTNFSSVKTPDAAHVLSRRRPAAVRRQTIELVSRYWYFLDCRRRESIAQQGLEYSGKLTN